MSKFMQMTRELSYIPPARKPPDTENHRTPTPLAPIGPAPIGVTPVGETHHPTVDDVLAALGTEPAGKSRGKVVEATRIEDGHSATQNDIYWYLWRVGTAVNGSRSRFVRAGYAQIANAVKADRSNVQDAIRELQKKFSIAVFRPSTTGSATVYEVLFWEDVMRKRQTSGMLWAYRYGSRRADLLTDPSLAPIGATPIGVTPIGPTPTANTPLTPIDLTPVGVTPIAPIGVTPIHIRSKEEEHMSSSSSDPGPLQDAIETLAVQARMKTPVTIDDPAGRTIERYRQERGATIEEAAHLLVGKMLQMERKRYANPLGPCLANVDCWLAPRDLKKLREARGRDQRAVEEWESQMAAELGPDWKNRG